MGNGMTPKPWSREKLDFHVMHCIREYVDAALVFYRNRGSQVRRRLPAGGEPDSNPRFPGYGGDEVAL
jgi:hypothetical protein